MSKITVELIDSMGNDLRIANVARCSFNKWKEEFDEKDAKLIDYLAKHEHSSPFRHTAITLRCEGPIWLLRQLVKHQVGMSWNEVSRRYVDTGFEYFMPEYRERPEGSIKQGSGGTHPRNDYWQERTRIAHDYLMDLYDNMIEDNVTPEQARGILPLNLQSTWIWTGSLTAFFHMYRLRSGSHAQVEAQQFAKLVGDIIEPIFPISWAALKSA